jgi:large subunit ribosomal protein L9
MASKLKPKELKGRAGNLKLVLVEDVAHLGKQGDLVEVKAGYGRNYLLPNGLATVPTAHNLKLLDLYKQRVHQAREAKMDDLKVLAEQIQRVPSLTIEALAYEAHAEQTTEQQAEGADVITHFHLYGSVGGAEISKALKGKNLKVEPDMVKLDGVIKICGLYEVNLHLGYDVTAKVKVMVVPQKQ